MIDALPLPADDQESASRDEAGSCDHAVPLFGDPDDRGTLDTRDQRRAPRSQNGESDATS